jgi:desampylase
MKLQISSRDRQILLETAAATPNAEVCGLLLGNDGKVETLVPTRNVARDPARSFEIDPAALLATHSHPNGRQEPSRRDAARAADNGQIWLIIAGGTLSAWLPQAAGSGPATFQPVAIEVA